MGFLDELENLNEQDTRGKIPGKPNRPVTSSRELAKVTEKQVDDLHEKPRKGELGNEEVIASNFAESYIANINEALVLIEEAEDILNEKCFFSGLREKRAKRKLDKAEKHLGNMKEDEKVYRSLKLGDKEIAVAQKRIAKAEKKLADAKAKYEALKSEAQDTVGTIPGQLKEVKSEKELSKVPAYQKVDIKTREVKGELGNEEVIEKDELSEAFSNVNILIAETEYLLNEAFFKGLKRRKLRRLKEELEEAIEERQEMEEKYKNRDFVQVIEYRDQMSRSINYSQGGGYSPTYARTTVPVTVEKSVREIKKEQDMKIKELEVKIAKLKEKLGESADIFSEQNTLGTIPGKPNGPITSSRELAKVHELQQVEELKPRFDQMPKGGKSVVRNIEEDDSVEKEIVEDERELGVQESVTVENIQVFTREQGEYFISESAFHACCESYPRNSQIDVLYAIAEAYNIDVDDIFFLEGEDTAKKRVRAKIDRLKRQLKDTAPSSQTAKDLRKRIKQLKTKL